MKIQNLSLKSPTIPRFNLFSEKFTGLKEFDITRLKRFNFGETVKNNVAISCAAAIIGYVIYSIKLEVESESNFYSSTTEPQDLIYKESLPTNLGIGKALLLTIGSCFTLYYCSKKFGREKIHRFPIKEPERYSFAEPVSETSQRETVERSQNQSPQSQAAQTHQLIMLPRKQNTDPSPNTDNTSHLIVSNLTETANFLSPSLFSMPSRSTTFSYNTTYSLIPFEGNHRSQDFFPAEVYQPIEGNHRFQDFFPAAVYQPSALISELPPKSLPPFNPPLHSLQCFIPPRSNSSQFTHSLPSVNPPGHSLICYNPPRSNSSQVTQSLPPLNPPGHSLQCFIPPRSNSSQVTQSLPSVNPSGHSLICYNPPRSNSSQVTQSLPSVNLTSQHSLKCFKPRK